MVELEAVLCEKNAVRASEIGDVFKIWFWWLGSLIVALVLAPLAFDGGKALWELSPSKDFSGAVNKVAVWSGTAGMEDFFKLCWLLVAVVLLVPMMGSLRLAGRNGGQPLRSVSLGLGSLLSLGGALVSFGCLFLIGQVMIRAGIFVRVADVPFWRTGMFTDVLWCLVIAAASEILFRMVVLGIFLRAMRVVSAIVLAALMFAGIRFILSGVVGVESSDGEALSALELGAAAIGGGNMLERILIVFLPWFVLGCVLGWARWRTASVWLPAGLLMGWLLAERLFRQAVHPVELTDRVAGYFSAGSLHAGIIPLIAALAIGGLVHIITQAFSPQRDACG